MLFPSPFTCLELAACQQSEPCTGLCFFLTPHCSLSKNILETASSSALTVTLLSVPSSGDRAGAHHPDFPIILASFTITAGGKILL